MTYYGFGFFLCGLAFLVWVGSLVILLTNQNDNSTPPEKVQLRKKVKGLNIALICVVAFCTFILYNFLFAVAMIVLAVFCVIETVKLLKMNSRSSQQQGQNYYQGTPPQQAQAAPQPQQQQEQARSCPNCGAQISADCYFCVHCGKNI